MIPQLIADPHRLGVLQALRAGGALRFCRLQQELRLNPAQVDRALKALLKGGWISAPRSGARRQYALSGRGAALLEAYRVFSEEIYRRREQLGSAAAEFRPSYQGLPTPGPAGIERTVRIVPARSHGAGEEKDYLAACLRLSPEERVERMRLHSQRIKLLNPANPPLARGRRREVRIIHDAF